MRWGGKQMESFFFRGRVIFTLLLFIFFFQAAVERHPIYLEDDSKLVARPHGGLKPRAAGLTARQTQTDS